MPQLHPCVVLLRLIIDLLLTGFFGRLRVVEDCCVCDFHAVFRERSSLIRAENIDAAKCFDSAETFAEDFILLHCVGDDGK